jgi:hypothetical protein
MFRLDEQEGIGLGHVVQVKPHGAVVTPFDARRTTFVRAEPEIEMKVLSSMVSLPDR